MLKVLAIFFATLLVACAINFQYRNAIKGHYISIALTSCFIGSLNLFMLKTIPNVQEVSEGVAYILGGAIGSVLAAVFHKRIFEKA